MQGNDYHQSDSYENHVVFCIVSELLNKIPLQNWILEHSEAN